MGDHLRIEAGGLLSTLQDQGRYGFQQFGVSAAGAVDQTSLAIANALVGNPLPTAAIEMTLSGPSLTVEAELCRVAIAGAELRLAINGEPAQTFTAYDLRRGDRLETGVARSGMRAYLAVAGGFDVAPTLGSLSTHARSQLGGPDGRGRPLQAGDRLPLREGQERAGELLSLPERLRPAFAGPIRVVLGPQDDAFTHAGIETFLSGEFRVSAKTDRMGCQLEGPPIEHRDGFNIISDGIMNGSIQVPGHGRPIILLADRQTTGGYPKIATVISPDLAKMAQRRPGEVIRFERVSPEDAEVIAVEHAQHRARWASLLVPFRATLSSAQSLERLMAENLISGVVDAVA
jgi:biotin-dependent carboxylase-like uncharacterized protein